MVKSFLIMGSVLLGIVQPAALRVRPYEGVCEPSSHVSDGPLGADLTQPQYQAPFRCDTAILSTDSRSPKVLIQFLDSADHTPVLGFAGEHTENNIVTVHQLYFAADVPTTVTEGYCKFFDDGIVCGVKVDEGGRRRVAIVSFKESR